jgi:signal transduction histidine kinase/CheY-like chemotaxis protein
MFAKSVWQPRLRLRILAPAALVAIPAIVFLVYMSFERRAQAELALTQNALQLARLATVDQERLIEGTRQLLISLSQSHDVQEGNLERCKAYLQQLLPQFGATYNNLAVADVQGNVTCSGVDADVVSIADRLWFRATIEQQGFVVGEYVIGRQTGKASLPFGYPVRDSTGRLRGVVLATVDLQRLNESLTDTDWSNDVTLTVIDRGHTVIAHHPEWQKWVGRSLKDTAITARIGPSPRGVIEYVEDGERQLVAYTRIDKPTATGLTVRVFVAKTRAMASANRSLHEGLVALALMSFLVLIGVKAASDRLLLEPIVRLTKASRRLAAGDLQARAASSTTIPELSELGKDFDDMAAALEEREVARLRAETERKDLEQQYHQSQKMDAVGRLAGGIAHDFNNMLTAILGYSELLLEDQSLSVDQRSDIGEIDKAGRTAAALTRQLLAFSRREIVEPTVLDVNTVFGGMDKMLHRLIGEHLQMEIRLAPKLDPVKADRGQIEQVILNLIVNARDAMPQGGSILIETANLDMPDGVASAYLSAPPGRYVIISVIDTGFGMSADVLVHLFEPFFTTKTVGKGTGLGLATIYGIAKQSGGGITVQSELGKGSTFRIYLPRCDESITEAAAVTAVERPPAKKATILIVEDDPGIRELTAKVLSRYGYVVLTAEGGEHARLLSESHSGDIDLLLSDVVMPGMSGPMVAEMLTKMRPSMKVVYMSGYTDDSVVRHGVMVHDMPFLQKPFTPERLVNKIADVLAIA